MIPISFFGKLFSVIVKLVQFRNKYSILFNFTFRKTFTRLFLSRLSSGIFVALSDAPKARGIGRTVKVLERSDFTNQAVQKQPR